MKINSINFFKKRERYISSTTLKDANSLIEKMHMEKTYKEITPDFFEKTEVRGLKIKDATFKDGQFLARRNSKKQLIPYGKDSSMLEFGEIRLIFNNSSGKIIEHEKPFFTTWKKIFRQAQEIISLALSQYNNDNIVKKIVHHSAGLTNEGKIKAADELKKVFSAFKIFK